MQVKSSLPVEMATPDPQWELEHMTVGNVCEFLKGNGFPEHIWEIFEVIFGVELNCKTCNCVNLLHAMVVPQIKSWMEQL